MKPLYLVSSISRSGSSMAMRCLEAGGLDAVYDGSHEPFNLTHGDEGYQPNGNGFYALAEDFSDPTFYFRHEGHLVKCPWQMLRRLPLGDYRLLFMLRDPAEIAASMERFRIGFGSERILVDTCYTGAVNTLFAQLRARGDFHVQALHYADVVADPVTAFASLGWPINPELAAASVDESLHRFRLESI